MQPVPLLQPQPGALPAHIGEYQLAVTYPWIPAELVDKVHQDSLSIYNLPKLANPSWPGITASEDPAMVVIKASTTLILSGPLALAGHSGTSISSSPALWSLSLEHQLPNAT
ncbi:hypothetical protein [Sporisorium scitamineum]|uniref:Uncharacterized protein n=1 Tax=Sporisorium scitamineum TaxID=49012 RepID=A0A0F7RXE0_9BASI|nr:hypothetical protein [Sporisorium scitamineum]